MVISPNNLDMLYRYALAEFFTSPTVPARYDRGKAASWLLSNGLVGPGEGGVSMRITDLGRTVLKDNLDASRAAELEECLAQRDRLRKHANATITKGTRK